MVNQLVERRLGLDRWKAGRLTQLLLLAMTMLAYCIVATNVANALFLSHVGSEKLPLSFILLGIFSIFAYAVVSQTVDRFGRGQLFRYTLVGSLGLVLTWWLLLPTGATPLYFALLIYSFFQWDLFVNILFPNLLTDYFTTLEYKRYTPFIGIAQAAGIFLGGGLTAFLSGYISTRNLLLCLAGIISLALAQAVYLESSQRRLETNKSAVQVSFIESLKSFPELSQRYPLVPFLAGSTFLVVVSYMSSEYLWFSIYEREFSEAELARFLGLIRVLTSAVQVFAVYGITRPLLQRLGVGQTNLIYPLTTLGTLLGLVFNLDLRWATIVNLNGDALNKGINGPVHQLHFNAIPPEFSGRVRALSDGFVYAIALTLSGIFLIVAQEFLSLKQIGWIATGLAFALLALRVPMASLYGRGLEETLRSGAINLDEFDYQTQLPAQSIAPIRELLADRDRYSQVKGLELAAKQGNPGRFWEDVEPLLGDRELSVRRAVVKLFSAHPDSESIAKFVEMLDDLNPVRQATALAVLIACRYEFEEERLRSLLGAEHREVNVLAAVAATQMDYVADPQIRAICDQIWHSELEPDTAKTVLRAIADSGDRDSIPAIEKLVERGNADVKQEGFAVLAELARPGDIELSEMAVAELGHSDALVRAAAFNLLGIARGKGMLRHAAIGLGDPDPRVREKVANVLAAYGSQGLALAQDSLSSSKPEIVQTAIAAIGKVGTKSASNILYDYLQEDFQEVSRTRKWQTQIPQSDPDWQPLAIAITDYHQRLIQKLLYVLSCLGHSRSVNTVNRILYSTDSRDVANAIEVLASLSNRRFVSPLVPILEQLANREKPSTRARSTPQWLRTKGYKVLLEALEAKDRWIRIGASIALAMVPSALMRDVDPLVRSIARQMFVPVVQRQPENTFMNRLLLLKNVGLFKNLTLDELLSIDRALEQQQVSAGQTIFTEGEWATHFYIIADGSVRIVKEIDGEQRELKQLSVGQYFGEVALFDEAPRWDGAIAIKDSTLLKLERSRFLSLITQRPQIILEMCRFLSQRLRETDKYRSARKLLPPSEAIESVPSSEVSVAKQP